MIIKTTTKVYKHHAADDYIVEGMGWSPPQPQQGQPSAKPAQAHGSDEQAPPQAQ